MIHSYANLVDIERLDYAEGAYKMIEIKDVTLSKDYDKDLFATISSSVAKNHKKMFRKMVKRKHKKEITEVGSYCPKKKPGQSWAYSKDNKEEASEDSDVA